MRKTREVLRLHEAEHLIASEVGSSVGPPGLTVRHVLDRVLPTGLS